MAQTKTDKLERCTHCDGRKKIMGMGGLQKDCPTCMGVGHVIVPLFADKKDKK